MTSIKLTTPVSIPTSDVSITHQEAVFLIGSCFTQNIGQQLSEAKFNVNINPNGIIFNPISVANTLKRVAKNQHYTLDDLIKHNEKWLSLDHHSSFSATNKNECLTQINESLESAHQHLQKCKTIFITFGSAWVYEYESFGIVANCHKIPNKQFTKSLLTVKEVMNAFEDVYDELKIEHPNTRIVFTVSPVRHAKDGLHENNLSKATLLLAINNLVEQNENCHYFPAYELVIDELRDYRFYKEDLVHPTELAVNYVWEKFSDCYFNEATQQLNTEIQQIKTAANHKPFNFESTAHQQFIAKQIQLMDALSKKHPFLNFEEEIQSLNSPF